MTARSFVVARGEGKDRQYFAGTDDEDYIMLMGIFMALTFDTVPEAAEAIAFLRANGLTGFSVFEITSGASDNLKGETA